MKQFVMIVFGLLVTTSALAQSWSEAQKEVWSVVAASWVDDVGETGDWPEAYAADGFTNWGQDVAIPMQLAEASESVRFGDASSQTVYHREQPVNITINGDTAVVNYYATSTSEDKDGKRSKSTQAITETLVKREGEWKFLASASWEPAL